MNEKQEPKYFVGDHKRIVNRVSLEPITDDEPNGSTMKIEALTVKTCPHCGKKLAEVVNIHGDRVFTQPVDYARNERKRRRVENLIIKYSFILFVVFGISAIVAAYLIQP